MTHRARSYNLALIGVAVYTAKRERHHETTCELGVVSFRLRYERCKAEILPL